MENIRNLQSKVNKYKEVLNNTENYRKAWDDGLKKMIMDTLEKYAKEVGLNAKIDVQKNIKHLEAISFSLGKKDSGIYEIINDETNRPIVKFYGLLVFQQMFNGKVNVMMLYPFIEGIVDPRPPKQIEILRPHELTEPFIVRHLEIFIKELVEWEDLDDDETPLPQIGYHHHIGFANTSEKPNIKNKK